MAEESEWRVSIRRLRCRRDADLGGAIALKRWRGGMKWGWSGMTNCSWPLATLTVFPTGVELGPSVGALLFLVPVWRARLGELSAAEVVETRVYKYKGIRFTTNDGSSVAFGAPRFPHGEVLSLLEGMGVQVDRSPQHLHLFGPP
jgi:hypothetical protein